MVSRSAKLNEVILVSNGMRGNKTMTNYDHIRNMSVEELAEFMNKCGWDFPPYCDHEKAENCECDQNCLKCAKEWLEAEVTE